MTDIKIKRYADKENLKELMKYSKDTFANNSEVVHKSGDETIADTKTFSKPIVGSVTGSSGSCTGNAATATTAGAVNTVVADGSAKDLVYASMAGSDAFHIRCGGDSDAGYLEIATADNGNEPIYVRQYNINGESFGSVARTLTLLDGSGNTQFPGTVSAPTFSGNLNGNAATATTAANGVDSQGWDWIRFKNGVQICWGYGTSGFAFPKPFTAVPAVSLIHQTFANRKILINVAAMDSRNCYYNAYDVEGGIYIDASVSYTAFGYWK